MHSPTHSLTVTCLTGLGNRLRVLLNGIALAEASGREFAMVWTPAEPCGCRFDELFSNAWNVRSDLEFDDKHAINLEGLSRSQLPDLLAYSNTTLSVRHWGWIIDPARFPAHVALEERSRQLWRELEPLPFIARQVMDFRSAYFRSSMIGVHLRLGDRLHNNPRWNRVIPIAMHHVDKFLDQSPRAGILLCTDEGAPEPYTNAATPHINTAQRFVKRYGKRVVWTIPPSLDRHSPEAIQAGVVDLWLLRETDFIVGTRLSSFSEFGPYGRDTPYISITPYGGTYDRLSQMLSQLGLRDRVRRIGRDANGDADPHAFIAARYLRRLLTNLATKV